MAFFTMEMESPALMSSGERIRIKGSAVTGYGEDLIKNAFSCDLGLVETVAHYRAAAHFNPDVDFIIDIGGQDPAGRSAPGGDPVRPGPRRRPP